MLENPHHYEEDAKLERAYLRRVVGVVLLGAFLLAEVIYFLTR